MTTPSLSPAEASGERSRRWFLCALPVAYLGWRSRQAGAQSSTPSFSVTTKLVTVYVTVRDKHGALIQNLQQGDFTLREDGQLQTIRYFSRDNDLPLTLGLLVDTSPSEERMIETERAASRQFFETVLRPEKDHAFLVHFDRSVDLLQGLTSSLPKLEGALDKLRGVEDKPHWGDSPGENGPDQDSSSNAGENNPGNGPPTDSRGGDGGTTHLFDAVYLASHDVLRSQTGRKALVIIGDGDDMGSKVTKEQAIRAAQEADALIYCIRIEDKDFGKQHGGSRPHFSLPIGIPGVPGMGGPGGGQGGGPGGGQGGPGGWQGRGPGGAPPDRREGKKNMEALATETGGTLFEVSKKLPLGEIFQQIQEELRTQYYLGYTPPAGEPGYRHIEVRVTPKDAFVRARDGYYASGSTKSTSL